MPTTITLPQGNTLTQTIRVANADGEPFSADDYAVVKVRNSINDVVWSGVFNLGDAYDADVGAAMVAWEISGAESAKIRPGRYTWDLTAHIGASLNARGQPMGAAQVITPEAVRMSDFIVEKVVSHGKCD